MGEIMRTDIEFKAEDGTILRGCGRLARDRSQVGQERGSVGHDWRSPGR